MSNIGIMDPAFFVGKNVLLKWLNDTFQIGYTKVEQCASGAIHCQILDAIFPGTVPLHKVNFDAKFDYEFVKNFKVLQDVFNKQQITKHVDVDKLVKAKYQDNLEFLQWIKNFYDTKYNGQPYNAVERRAQAKKGGIGKPGGKHVAEGKENEATPAPAAAPTAAAKPNAAAKLAAKPTAKLSAAPKPAAAAAAPAAKPSAATKPTAKLAPRSAAKAGAKKDDGATNVDDLNEQISKLRLAVESVEKERNFYFGKLRDIEILCQTDTTIEQASKDAILKILYQTDDSDEFVGPEQTEAEAAGENGATEDNGDVDDTGAGGEAEGADGLLTDQELLADSY